MGWGAFKDGRRRGGGSRSFASTFENSARVRNPEAGRVAERRQANGGEVVAAITRGRVISTGEQGRGVDGGRRGRLFEGREGAGRARAVVRLFGDVLYGSARLT